MTSIQVLLENLGTHFRELENRHYDCLIKNSSEGEPDAFLSEFKSFRNIERAVPDSKLTRDELKELADLRDRFMDDLAQLKLTLIVGSETENQKSKPVDLKNLKLHECIELKFENLQKELLSLYEIKIYDIQLSVQIERLFDCASKKLEEDIEQWIQMQQDTINQKLARFTEKSEKFLENISFETNRTSQSLEAINQRISDYYIETNKSSQSYKKDRKLFQESFENLKNRIAAISHESKFATSGSFSTQMLRNINQAEKLGNDSVIFEYQQNENFGKILKEGEAFRLDSKRLFMQSRFHIDYLKTYCKDFGDYIQSTKKERPPSSEPKDRARGRDHSNSKKKIHEVADKLDAKSPVAYRLIPYLDKTSPFKDKVSRLSPVRNEYRKSLSPKDNTVKSPSTRMVQQASKASGRYRADEVSRKDEVIKKLTIANKAIQKEHEKDFAVVDKKLTYVKACIRNFISTTNKLAALVDRNTPESESALMSYENNRAILEHFSQALDDIQNSEIPSHLDVLDKISNIKTRAASAGPAKKHSQAAIQQKKVSSAIKSSLLMTPVRNPSNKSQKNMLINSFEKIGTRSPKIFQEEILTSKSMLLGLDSSVNNLSPKNNSSENILNYIEEYENNSLKNKYDQLIEENAKLSQDLSISNAKNRDRSSSTAGLQELQEKMESLEHEKQRLVKELERVQQKADNRKKDLKQLFELLNNHEKNSDKTNEAFIIDPSKGKAMKQIEEHVLAKEKEIQGRLLQIELMLKGKEEELDDLVQALGKITLKAGTPFCTQKEVDEILASKSMFVHKNYEGDGRGDTSKIIESSIDQVFAIENTRDKLFGIKSNLKSLSLEKKQKLDKMLVHLSTEKARVIQKIPSKIIVTEGLRDQSKERDQNKSSEKEISDLKIRTIGISPQRRDIPGPIGNLRSQYQFSDSKFLEENANLKRKMEKLNEKIRQFENKEIQKYPTALSGSTSLDNCSCAPKINELFDVLQIDREKNSHKSNQSKLDAIKIQIIELNAGFKEKDKIFTALTKELTERSPNKSGSLRLHENSTDLFDIQTELENVKLQLAGEKADVDHLNRVLHEKDNEKRSLTKLLENAQEKLNQHLRSIKKDEAEKKELEYQLSALRKAIIQLAQEIGIGTKGLSEIIIADITNQISKHMLGLNQKEQVWQVKEIENKIEVQQLIAEKNELTRKLDKSLHDFSSCLEELKLMKSQQSIQNQKDSDTFIKEKERLVSQVRLLEEQIETIREENKKLSHHNHSYEAKEKSNSQIEKNMGALEEKLKTGDEEVMKLKAAVESSKNQLKISTKIFEDAELTLKNSNKELKGNFKALELRNHQALAELADAQVRNSKLENEQTELSDLLHKTVEDNLKQATPSQNSLLQTLNQKESELNQLKHDVRAKEKKINELMNSLHRVSEELQQQALLNKSTKQSLLDNQKDIEAKETKIQELEHQFSMLGKQRMRDDLSAKNNIDSLPQTIRLLENERDELKLKLEATSLALQERGIQISNLKTSLIESESEKASVQHENQKSKLEFQKLGETNAQLENNLKGSLTSSESNKQLIAKTIDNLKQDKAGLEKELSTTNQNLNQVIKELNEIKSQLKSAIEELESERKKLSENESTLKGHLSEIKELQSNLNEVSAEKGVMQQNFYRVESEKEEMKFILTKIQNELVNAEAVNQEKIVSLKTEMNKLKVDLSEREQELAQKNQEIDGCLDNFDKLSSELSILKIQQENSFQTLKEAQHTESQSKRNLANLEDELAKTKGSNASLMNQITTLKTSNFILNNNFESLKAEKKILSDKLKELEANIDRSEALLLHRENEIGALKQNIEYLKSRLNEELEVRAMAERENNQKRQNEEKLSEQLSGETAQKHAFARALTDCKIQLEQLIKKNVKLEETNLQLSEKISLELNEQKKYYENKLIDYESTQQTAAMNHHDQVSHVVDATEIQKLNNQIEIYEDELKKLKQAMESKCTEYEKKLGYQEAKYKALEKLNTQSTNSAREIPQEIQKWRDFASFLNEKALTFLAYLGVPESDVIFSPIQQTDEFKSLTEDIIRRFAVAEENLKQYSFAQENFQKTQAENQDLKRLLAVKETEYKAVIKQIEQTKIQGKGGDDSSVEGPKLEHIHVNYDAYSQHEIGSRVEAEESFTSDDFKSLQDRMRKYQDEIEIVNDGLHEVRQENEMLKAELKRMMAENSELIANKNQLVIKEKLLREEITELEQSMNSPSLKHEKQHLRQMFIRLFDSLLEAKKDSFELLKVILSLLEFNDADKNAYLENIKSKGKKAILLKFC